jgi:hypothetical protein
MPNAPDRLIHAAVSAVAVCCPPPTRQVFRLPQLMLDAPEVSRVLAKARSKLLDLYGDLEKVCVLFVGFIVDAWSVPS